MQLVGDDLFVTNVTRLQKGIEQKAATTVHIDAVMSVMRRSIWDKLQKVIDSLDDCLLDISSSSEIEEVELED